MGLEVYYPDDIRNALLAVEHATDEAAEFGGRNEDYLAGYRAALKTIALAFGVADFQEKASSVVPHKIHLRY